MKRLTTAALLACVALAGCAPEPQHPTLKEAQERVDAWDLQQAESSRAEAIREAQQMAQTRQQRLAAIRRHPTPAMQAYADKLGRLSVIENQARAAAMCQLRSDAWQAVINHGLFVAAHDAATHSGLSMEEQQAVVPTNFGGKPFSLETTCPALINSPTMDRLDRLEWDLTGGYH
jgi:hypothetical protein